MAISNDTDLCRVCDEVSVGLAEIQAYLGDRNHANGKIRFPRGYLRTAASVRESLWYISNETIKRNLAYAHIQSDALRWLLNRTDLAGTAREMIIKESICLSAAICETLTKQAGVQQRLCRERMGFKGRCNILRNEDAISAETCDALKWLWGFRQNEHIFLAPDWEYGFYKMADCNRAVRVLHALKGELDRWFRNISAF